MYKELRARAKKKVQAKMAFYVCTIIFTIASLVLVMLSFYMPFIAFWLMFPIPIFVMVLAILYLFAFGPLSPGMTSSDWQEEEIEKEILRQYKSRKVEMPVREELSDSEVLELKELEYLERKWYGNQDYV